jgi:hypothetical protein
MPELKLYAPTYNRGEFRATEPAEDLPEFGEPSVPVVVRDADGVRIVLGSHDYWAKDMPDVQIERRPGGWAIFLHPVGGSDPSGYVYFLDNGLSYLCPEDAYGGTYPIMTLRDTDSLRRLDEPASDVADPAYKPCELCGLDPKALMDDWSELCPDCGDLVRKFMELKRISPMQRRIAIEFLKRKPCPVTPDELPLRPGSRRTMK